MEEAVIKAHNSPNSLLRILPRTGKARENRRRTIALVVDNIVLYGAPAWAGCVKIQRYAQALKRAQRKIAIRVARAYRTVGTEAVRVLARTIPVELLAEERAVTTEMTLGKEADEIRIIKEQQRKRTIQKWQELWDREAGKWTYRLIPRICPWLERKHGLPITWPCY
jgi:hypothetical protein